MRCRTAQTWMERRRDERLSLEKTERLEQHLKQCATCAGVAAADIAVNSLLSGVAAEEPSANFDWRLRLRLARAERDGVELGIRPVRSPWAVRLQFSASMVAAAAIVIVAGRLVLEQPGTRNTPILGNSAWVPRPDGGGVVQPVRDQGRIVPQSRPVVGPVPQDAYFGPARQSSVVRPDSSARTSPSH